MRAKSLARTLFVFLCVLIAGAGCGGVTRSPTIADAPATPVTKQAENDELHQLLVARYICATNVLNDEQHRRDAGKATFEMVCQAARRARDAEVALAAQADDQIAAFAEHVALMRQLEQRATEGLHIGVTSAGEVEAVRYWRLTAEIELFRAKHASTGPKYGSTLQPTTATEDELHQLLLARYVCATNALSIEQFRLERGVLNDEMIWRAAERIRDAELELAANPDRQIAVLTKYLVLMRQREQQVSNRVAVGAVRPTDLGIARYWRLTAEADLLRAKSASSSPE